MSNNGPGPRPQQVTIGGWVTAVASAVLVVTVFDSMAELHSVDTRNALTTGWAKDFGISVDDALRILRGALFVAGTAAAVTGILGIFVLQRHTAARIALTIAAVPVVLTAPVAGNILGLMVGGAVALLWSQPARDWFAGRPPTRSTPVRGLAGRESPAAHRWAPPTQRPGEERPPPPAPTPGWGAPPVPSRPPALGADPSTWPPPTYLPPMPGRRAGAPIAVRAACILTWAFSAVTAILCLVVVVAVAADRQDMLDQLRDNADVRDASLSDDSLIALLIVMCMVIILWCIAAAVLAALTRRRSRWAWIALLVSAGAVALVSVLAFPVSLAHLAASGTALGLLLNPPTRAWFRDDNGTGSPPPPTSTGHGWPPPEGPPAPPSHSAPQAPDRSGGKPPVW